MNCREFNTLAPALARNRLLEATMREQGMEHTEVCTRCAARLAEERASVVGVNAVIADLAEENTPARVEETLLAAFRAQTNTSTSPTILRKSDRVRGPIRRWSTLKRTAIAAGILLLISVMAVLWRSVGSLKNQREDQAVRPTPNNAPAPLSPPNPAEPQVGRGQLAKQQPVNTEKRGRRQPAPAYEDNSDEAEVVTQFFPLREGEDLTALESVRLVRVELPGSALGEVGLPVDPELANEPVKADVMLGQDGLARAIRFVR
jgi:hypothetical protein